MPPNKTSAPSFFQIQVESRGSSGALSYDCQRKTVRVQGMYRPNRPRYLADDSAPVIRPNERSSAKLRRIRPRPKEFVTPTQDEWSLLIKIADLVCLWGIRGTNDFLGICDGTGYLVDIEFEDRILQSPITFGEHDSQWGLFDAACRALVGESRFEILSRYVEPIWDIEYSETAYIEFRDSPETAAATTLEILKELLALWEKAVTPPGHSLPATISDWESAASHWASQANGRRQKLCQEVLESLLRDKQTKPSQIRPWWEGASDGGPSCPTCGQPLRTEESEQCFSCGAGWHGRDLHKQSIPILNGGWAVWLFLSVLICTFMFLGISFAKRPFNATQYVFFAIFACAAVACAVKGLLYSARRLELSKADLKIKFSFRTIIIDWSMIKFAAFVDNRGQSKFLGSIYDFVIPVPVGGILPNISYNELLLRLENGKKICVPVSPEFNEAITKTISELASLDPAFKLARSAREKERDRVESRTFSYIQGVLLCLGGLVIVSTSIARAIKMNAWSDSLGGFAFGFFILGLGAFFILKEANSKRVRRSGRREHADRSEGHAQGAGKDLSWAERIRGSKK